MNFKNNFEKNNFEKYNDVINKLQDYIICEKYIKMIKQDTIKHKTTTKHNKTKNMNNNNNNNINKIQDSLYYPKDQDDLYWIFYILQNGIMDYEYNKNNRFIIEKEDKINYIENIKQHKEIIKRQKLMTLSDFENNLVVEKKININAFLNLCAIKKINVIIVKNKFFYELLCSDDEEVYIIYNKKVNSNCSNYERNGFEVCKKNDAKWNKIYSEYLQTNNIMCPIKSISYYKLDDLINICKKMGLSVTIDGTSKNKKKIRFI